MHYRVNVDLRQTRLTIELTTGFGEPPLDLGDSDRLIEEPMRARIAALLPTLPSYGHLTDARERLANAEQARAAQADNLAQSVTAMDTSAPLTDGFAIRNMRLDLSRQDAEIQRLRGDLVAAEKAVKAELGRHAAEVVRDRRDDLGDQIIAQDRQIITAVREPFLARLLLEKARGAVNVGRFDGALEAVLAADTRAAPEPVLAAGGATVE